MGQTDEDQVSETEIYTVASAAADQSEGNQSTNSYGTVTNQGLYTSSISQSA